MKNTSLLLLLACLAVSPLLPLRASGVPPVGTESSAVMVSYMVNPDTGDDATADGTAANPYKDIAVAVEAVKDAGGGDVVIMDGTYNFTEGSQIVLISTAATAATAVTIRPQTEYGVTINFSTRACFQFDENSSYITLEGLEIYGGTDVLRYWSIVSDDLWNANPNEGDRGGGQCVIAEGEHITVRNNYLHDSFQKGVEIRGRYIVIEGNIISGIATTSLSGGHGIMRQQTGREFFTNDDPNQYRWEIRQNMLYNIEQRIYSWVAAKGFMEMVIDEGKSILIDDPKDDQANRNAGKGIQDQMTALISDNIVAFGSVDHVRLKSTPGLEVSYNSIYGEGDNADGITDKGGDTNTPKFVDFRFIGNVARSNTWERAVPVFSLECDDAIDQSTETITIYADDHTLADHLAGSPKITTYTGAAAVVQNNVGFNGRTKPRGGSAPAGIKESTGEPFVDALGGNFRLSPDAAIPAGIDRAEVGIRSATHDALDTLLMGFGVDFERTPFVVDNRKLSQTIFDNIPGLLDGDDSNDFVFDGAGFTFSTHNGERTFLYPIIDGAWASTRRIKLENTPNMEFRLNEEYHDWYEDMAANHPNAAGEEYDRYRLGSSELTQDQIFDNDWLLVSEITNEDGDFTSTTINAFNDVEAYSVTLDGDLLLDFIDGVPDDGSTFDLILAGDITTANTGDDLFDRVLIEAGDETLDDYTLEIVDIPATTGRGVAVANVATQALRLTIGAVLPIDLLSFTGERTAKGAHVLNWETAMEDGNERFDLQRNAAGNGWVTIATIAAAEDGAAGATYTHTDEAPLLGTNLYRLRQVDLDGTATLSSIVSLTSTGLTAIDAAFPNPFGDQLVIPTGGVEIEEFSLYTLDGRDVTQQAQISYEEGRIKLSTRDLPTGSYLIRINGDTQVAVKK